jgi:molybdenum cofactor sulfurtransferase
MTTTGITYLDHGGTTLASKTLLRAFGSEMQSTLLANPHSDTVNPSVSSLIVSETRSKVLQFFKADPDHFDVVFTANATGAVKLVMECFSGIEGGFDYHYHLNCHTSLVGVRELSNRNHCFATNEQTEKWLDGQWQPFETSDDGRPTLFAYPAQSNMNGQRLPLHWSHQLRKSGNHHDTYVLLDAAAFVSTSPLDLSDHVSSPDFIALSFYKIFGFPDLGALIVRKSSAHILEHRKYFGGGTTEMITCLEEKPWVARKEASLHDRLEDGTIAIRSILALRCALDNHQQLFVSMDEVSQHTSWLGKKMYERLSAIKHTNGIPVCHFYKATESTYGDSELQGATIALNVRKSDGSWLGPYAVGVMLRQYKIHVRTGSLCNPAGMASALELSPANIRMAYAEGFRCNQQEDIRTGSILFGMVRVTLGAMSTLEDVETLATFVETRFAVRDFSRQDRLTTDRSVGLGQKSKKVSMFDEKQETPSSPPLSSSSHRVIKVWRVIGSCFS